MVSTISRPSEGELRSAAAYIVEIEGGSRDPLLVSARQESVWKTRLVPQMGRTRLVNQKSFGELRLWHGRVDYAFRTQYGTGRLVFTRRYLANDVLITVWENYSDSADDVGAPRRTVTLEDAPGAGHGKYLSGAHYVLVDTIRSTNFIISEIVKSQLGSTGTTSSWSEWASSDNESVWKRLRKELAKEHLGPNNSAGCRWGGLRVVIDRDSDGKASAITEEWLDEAGGVLTAVQTTADGHGSVASLRITWLVPGTSKAFFTRALALGKKEDLEEGQWTGWVPISGQVVNDLRKGHERNYVAD